MIKSIILFSTLLFTIAFCVIVVGMVLPPKANNPYRLYSNIITPSTSNLPISIKLLPVADAKFPCFWTQYAKCTHGHIKFQAFLVEYENYSVIIDPVHNLEWHEKFIFSKGYNGSQYEKQTELLNNVSHMIFTHEHWDHVGALLDEKLLLKHQNKIHLTKRQLASKVLKSQVADHQWLVNNISTYNPEDGVPELPGINFYPAPGHTDGSQIISVKLQDGNHYYFIGDISFNKQNIIDATSRPRLVSWLTAEKSSAVQAQVEALHAFEKSHNNIVVIPAHDFEYAQKHFETL